MSSPTIPFPDPSRRRTPVSEGGTPGRAVESPEELLRRAQQGDAEAFDVLMCQHQRRVFGLAWRMLGTVEDARDATQETFLRFYRALHRVDPLRPLEPWLLTVTANVCRDLGRRRGRHQALALPLEDAAAEALADGDPAVDPGQRAAGRERWRWAARALGELPRKERAALVLRDVEGLAVGEVARRLGSSATTVRSQISRARRKMLHFLAHHDLLPAAGASGAAAPGEGDAP